MNGYWGAGAVSIFPMVCYYASIILQTELMIQVIPS